MLVVVAYDTHALHVPLLSCNNEKSESIRSELHAVSGCLQESPGTLECFIASRTDQPQANTARADIDVQRFAFHR